MSDPKYIWLSGKSCEIGEDGGQCWGNDPNFDCYRVEDDPEHVCDMPTRYEVSPERDVK
jgi:hypothetical protein